MHPMLYRHFQEVASKYALKGPFLEIGAAPGGKAILAGAYFKGKNDRFAINLQAQAQESGITFKMCNSNDMQSEFASGQFQSVLSNAVLEHDKYFWRSIDEMKRVLAPGGMLVVGAPGFIPLKQTKASISGLGEDSKATITYDVHARPDYWRFSRQAFKSVICEEMQILELRVVGSIPRLVAVAQKP